MLYDYVLPYGEAGCSYWGVLKQREVGVAASVGLSETRVPSVVLHTHIHT